MYKLPLKIVPLLLFSETISFEGESECLGVLGGSVRVFAGVEGTSQA